MTTGSGRALRMAYLIASVAGVLFFVMSVVLLGLLPMRALDADARRMAPEHRIPLTTSALRGRAIYAREGCAYCHTQQIRYLERDVKRFGAPTLAWETTFDYPQMWGTRRIGPDLSRASGNRPDDWQFAHLFAPRSVVPLSIMPSYRGLFRGAADQPTDEARDLVAYLSSLGRARELAAPEGEARAREACQCPNDHMAMMAFGVAPIDGSPARARRNGDVPALAATGDVVAGREQYRDLCAGCHGASGLGDGPAASALSPVPSDLSAHEYASSRLAEVLWNGVAGTAMPAWRDQSLGHLASLAEFVASLRTAPAAFSGSPSAPDAATLERGATIFRGNCVQCHGETGGGDGFSAAALPIAPTNFQRQRPSLGFAVSAIRFGINGTPMAPWTSRLTAAEIDDVAAFVRSLYQGDGRVGVSGGGR